MAKLMIRCIFYLSMLSFFSCNTGFAANFFDQRYRGWLWFEDREQTKEQKKSESEISPMAAKEEVEQFKRELEERKYVMLARPTAENVRDYRAKEAEMWNKGMLLQDAWDMANFLYPEQRDQINNPDNVHAVKLKRKLEQGDQDKLIKEFATHFELVAFFKSNCRYCHEFVPVLSSFVKEFAFTVETVILDDPVSSHKNSFLIKKLNIEVTPLIFAISRDGKTAFELIRGYVSISELRSAVSIAWKHLETQGFRRTTK